MSARFTMPVPGASMPVHFPRVVADELRNGLRVQVIPQTTVPAFTAMLIVGRGTSADPIDRPGLASLTGDLLDEGAGTRDAIELAEALARTGIQFDIDAGPDATWITIAGVTHHLGAAFDLLADIVTRPRLAEPDFERVRELRVNRLRQLSRSTGTIADRVFVSSIFGGHPYGHGALGTTASLTAMTAGDARAFWSVGYRPRVSTLIVSGAVTPADVMHAATHAFGAWPDTGEPEPVDEAPLPPSASRVWLVDRPGAPQSELRIGHVGPSRKTEAYHALVTLNALLGGQFTSRINRRLREEKGITYGARTSFDFRRLAGTFSCDTSVQADATATAVADVLGEYEAIRKEDGVTGAELAHAQASLTRGYVRHFETPGQLVRSAAQLVTYDLPADTFDRFVLGVESVTPADVRAAAASSIHPSQAAIVVVGDAAVCQKSLESLGHDVTVTTAEF